MHIAVSCLSSSDVIKQFLAADGETAKIQDNAGLTAMHMAIYVGYPDITQTFLTISDVSMAEIAMIRDNEGKTALHLTLEHGLEDVAKKLVRANPLTLTI